MNELLREYIDNVQKVSETVSVVLAPGLSEDEAIEQIQMNAVELYDYHERNDAILRDNLYNRRPEDLTEEDIAELLEFADQLGSLDFPVAYRVYDLIYKAAKLKGDRDLVIRSCYNMGICMNSLRLTRMNISIDLFADRLAKYFGEAADYLKEYDDITSPETRKYIIRSHTNRCFAPQYFNLTGREFPNDEADFGWYDNYRTLIGQAVDTINDEKKRNDNPEIPWDEYLSSTCRAITKYLTKLRGSVMEPEEYSTIAKDVLSCAEFLYNMDVKRMNEKGIPIPLVTRYRYKAALYHNGKISPNELMEELVDIYNSVSHDDFTSIGIFANLRVPMYLQYYSDFLDDEGHEKYDLLVKQACDGVEGYLRRIPRNRHIHELCFSLRETLWYRVNTRTTYRHQILDYILACHPPTYIHSLMVAWLAEKLFLRLAETDPESLVGVLGAENAADIMSGKNDLAKIVNQCGLYHDLGKCMIINHIGNYSRHLTDEELDVIKAHPKLGAELLQLLGGYDDHAQAALHHHRSYDLKGGYPFDAGDIPRRVKAIVDIITVADSLEAGTDNIGRCYAATKTVETLYSELRQWSGTRYAPYVVKLLDDPDFCESLKEELLKQRRSIYCKTYVELYDRRDGNQLDQSLRV